MNSEWPDWKDVGRQIQLTMPDGESVIGRLCADEFWTGEDEIPVFMVETLDGRCVSFAEADHWEFQSPAAGTLSGPGS
jgi:hypothetical protein